MYGTAFSFLATEITLFASFSWPDVIGFILPQVTTAVPFFASAISGSTFTYFSGLCLLRSLFFLSFEASFLVIVFTL